MVEVQGHELEREYLLGMHTGDKRCRRCGGSWAPDDRDRHGVCPG